MSERDRELPDVPPPDTSKREWSTPLVEDLPVDQTAGAGGITGDAFEQQLS